MDFGGELFRFVLQSYAEPLRFTTTRFHSFDERRLLFLFLLCVSHIVVFVDATGEMSANYPTTGSGYSVTLSAIFVDSRNLCAFQGQIIHQPLGAKNESYNRIFDVLGVDLLACTKIDQCN